MRGEREVSGKRDVRGREKGEEREKKYSSVPLFYTRSNSTTLAKDNNNCADYTYSTIFNSTQNRYFTGTGWYDLYMMKTFCIMLCRRKANASFASMNSAVLSP